jgi:hypothetical protein
MYCIYKKVLGFAGYILGLKSLACVSSPIFMMAEILGPTWYSRPGYLLIPIHNTSKKTFNGDQYKKLYIHTNKKKLNEGRDLSIETLTFTPNVFNV